jgi:hypothetical protein
MPVRTNHGSEIIARLGINDVWLALGGPPLRGGRGPAFWRGSRDLNISVSTERNCWHDHARDQGGGILRLVETVLGIDRRAALAWCADLAGVRLDDRPYTDAERREWGRRRRAAEEQAASIEDWSIGAGMRLADAKLDASDTGDIGRLAAASRALYELEQADPAELAAMFSRAEVGLRSRDEAAGQRWRGLCEWMCAAVVTRPERGADDNRIAA